MNLSMISSCGGRVSGGGAYELWFHNTRSHSPYRLHVASEDYHHILSKKKECEALDETEKLLPIDALGIVMIRHGEEFGDDSAFGMSDPPSLCLCCSSKLSKAPHS